MSVPQATFPSLIYLVGMPGCGKSSVGKVLAKELGYAFLDLDDVLEAQENATIAQIFEQKGQEYFRQAEANALRSVTASPEKGVVLATGGGAPCFHTNMDFMVGNGLPVYLQVSVAELVNRLTAQDLQVRPLLRDKSAAELEEYLAQTLAQRELFYRQAPVVVSVDRQHVAAVAQEITHRVGVF